MKPRLSHLNYCVLRGMDSNALGFVRAEPTPTGLTFTIRAEALRSELPLRLMLLSRGEEGAAFDLGNVIPDTQGCINQTINCPALQLTLWDAIGLAEDWPSGRLLAAGWLRDPSGPLWRLMEAAAQYLAVPCP